MLKHIDTIHYSAISTCKKTQVNIYALNWSEQAYSWLNNYRPSPRPEINIVQNLLCNTLAQLTLQHFYLGFCILNSS